MDPSRRSGEPDTRVERTTHTLELWLEDGVNHIDPAASHGNSELRPAEWGRTYRAGFRMATNEMLQGGPPDGPGDVPASICEHRNEMALEIDLFWSFRSPYSYLATKRIVDLARRYELDVRLRPVLPIAVRIPGFFERVNPLWPPYLLRDTLRIAQSLGLPYAWPRPDPIVQEFPSRVVAAEQPYIHRLTRLGALAAERGQGLPFIDEVSSLIWGGTAGWNEGSHLARAAARAGCDLAELDDVISRDAARLDRVIADNQSDLEKAGHWGVPTLVFRGEPFFGQDRIDLLVWRLRQNGLAERVGPGAG